MGGGESPTGEKSESVPFSNETGLFRGEAAPFGDRRWPLWNLSRRCRSSWGGGYQAVAGGDLAADEITIGCARREDGGGLSIPLNALIF
jgi:hypothetical protein